MVQRDPATLLSAAQTNAPYGCPECLTQCASIQALFNHSRMLMTSAEYKHDIMKIYEVPAYREIIDRRDHCNVCKQPIERHQLYKHQHTSEPCREILGLEKPSPKQPQEPKTVVVDLHSSGYVLGQKCSRSDAAYIKVRLEILRMEYNGNKSKLLSAFNDFLAFFSRKEPVIPNGIQSRTKEEQTAYI